MKTKRGPSPFLLVLLCAALSACSHEDHSFGQEAPVATGPETESETVLAGVPLESSGLTGFQPVLAEDDFTQGILYGYALDDSDPTRLVVRNSTKDSRTGHWDIEEYEFSTTFEIHHADSSGRDEFYLHGTLPGDGDVLEFWKRKTVQQAGGGGYLLERRELYRGPSLNVLAMGADPGQRYLMLVQDQPARVSQVRLPSGSPITVLYDTQVMPGLDAIRLAAGITPLQHATEGRLWLITTEGHADPGYDYHPRTILYDNDDDGAMDSWLSPLTYDDWEALGYRASVWEEDFVVK